MMLARVKEGYRWSIVQAFGGHEYVKTEWRTVPGDVNPVHSDLEFMEDETAAVDFEDETATDEQPKRGRPKK